MVDIEHLIKNKFNDLVVSIEAGEFLFKPEDALKVIDEIERLNLVIIGMDFWQKRGKDIVEVNSTEWSKFNQGTDASKNTIREARQLIRDGLSDNADYVSFILENEE